MLVNRLKLKRLFGLFSIFLLVFIAFGAGTMSSRSLNADVLSMDEQQLTVQAINKVIPATVTIIVYDKESVVTLNMDQGQQSTSTEETPQGGGTGFLISPDGLIMTNKHVVEPITKDKEFRIILNSGKKYYAQYIDSDPLNDLAILKIFDKNLPFVELGNSDDLQVGTTVIAIGNALGRYRNSATKGIVSGLQRSLTASDLATGKSDNLNNIIQTDAEINLGNSGGPLIDLSGKLVGINVAIDQSGSAIGFAIPVNDAKPVIKSITQIGKIVRPKLGLMYTMIDPVVAEENKLPLDYGAWVYSSDDTVSAIVPGSPADLAGIKDGDIIYEVNAIKIQGKKTLLSVLQNYKPGAKIGMKLRRGDKTLVVTVELGKF
jgi:serine protease Do